MTHRSGPTTIIVLASVLLALVLGGCTTAYRLTVVPSGGDLNALTADALATSTDISALASVTTTEAPAMRTTALEQLRTQGAFGQRAADLLTIGFPERTASVPVLVRGSKFNGVDSIVVVEAWGSAGGRLLHRRLWVFARVSGEMLRAASFR